MKRRVTADEIVRRHSKAHCHRWLYLAFAILVGCLGFRLWNRPAESQSTVGWRIPAGQFSADLRSLAAAMHYLMEPDVTGALPTGQGNQASPGLVQQTGGQPLATLNSSSNQMVGDESLTNRPARS